MEKVWNISDHPKTEHPPRTTMVGGKRLAPGKSIMVDADIARGKRVQADVKAGVLFVGKIPPPDYLQAKNLNNTRAPRRAVRSHGTNAAQLKAAPPAAKPEPAEELKAAPKLRVNGKKKTDDKK